jgi:hypothetical protein
MNPKRRGSTGVNVSDLLRSGYNFWWQCVFFLRTTLEPLLLLFFLSPYLCVFCPLFSATGSFLSPVYEKWKFSVTCMWQLEVSCHFCTANGSFLSPLDKRKFSVTCVWQLEVFCHCVASGSSLSPPCSRWKSSATSGGESFLSCLYPNGK